MLQLQSTISISIWVLVIQGFASISNLLPL